jgi:hypothetical protein
MGDCVDDGGRGHSGETKREGHRTCRSVRIHRPCARFVSRCLKTTRRVCASSGLWAAGCLGTVTEAEGSELRVWRDQSGKHEIAARFAAFENGIVVLEVESQKTEQPEVSEGNLLSEVPPGTSRRPPLPLTTPSSPGSAMRTIRVPCERLIMEDQQYIAEQMIPDVIDGTAIRLELLEVEQHIRLPLGSLPSTWEYEAIPVGVTSLKQTIDLQALLASEGYVPEPSRQVREASLKRIGQFPVPIEFKGGEAQLRVAVHLRQFQDSLVLALRPQLKVGNKTFDFAARALEKEGRGLARAIVSDQRKLLIAQKEIKILPKEIQKAQRQFMPLNLPGAQFHNGQVALHILGLEAKMQRAQRNLRSATRSLPLETARLKQLQFLHDVLQQHAGKIQAEFLVRRRCGEVVQPVLSARTGGRVTLGTNLPVIDEDP